MHAIKLIGLLVLACALAVVALILLKVTPRIQPSVVQPIVTGFDECAAAGNPVMESYPRQCRTKDGRLFIEEISNAPSESDSPMRANGCAVAGCSGQLCVTAEEASTIVTTCEFRAEYACYREASCAPQADGKCGWTETAELTQCLAHPPSLDMESQLEVQ